MTRGSSKYFDKEAFFIALCILVTVRIFSLVIVPQVIFYVTEVFLVCLILFRLMIRIKVRESLKQHFRPYVIAFVLLTLISGFSAYLNGQGFVWSIVASRAIYFWLLYLILHRVSFDPVLLDKFMITTGVIWSLIMICQQITYPNLLFNQELEKAASDFNPDATRGNILRVVIAGTSYGYFLVFYLWRSIYERFQVRNLLLFLMVIVALLLTGSRQIIFGVLIVLFLDWIISMNFSMKNFRLSLVVVLVGASFILYSMDYIMSLIELSLEQKDTSDEYIRSLEINFFLFEYWKNPLSYLIGNGWEHSSSLYGTEVQLYKDRLGYYRSDIGLIGALNKFGAIYIIAVFMFFFKILIPRKKFVVPRHIRLFFFFCLMTAFTGPNFFESSSIFLTFVFLLYQVDVANGSNRNSNSNL